MNEYPYFTKKEKNNSIIWLFFGLIAVVVIGVIIYFATTRSQSANKNPENPNPSPNIQYLPSEEESEKQIQQIKTAKNLDDQQAVIEFLTSYVPYINWWEINSLSELDEKINLVNNKTGFPPFKEVPNVDKFNKEVERNMMNKALIIIASVIPRKNDGSIDWKGLDFANYLNTVLVPLLEGLKYNPAMATQANYQELDRRIKQEVNSSLSSLCSKFANLSKVSELNGLINNYLGKIFQASVYADIHDRLAQQLAISIHRKYQAQATGNSSLNSSLNIILNEFAFKK